MFLCTQGAGRFQPSCGSSKADVEDGAHFTRDRAGFCRLNRQIGETEYLLFPGVFRAEVCLGHDPQAVAKELDRRGFLLREPLSLMIKPRFWRATNVDDSRKRLGQVGTRSGSLSRFCSSQVRGSVYRTAQQIQGIRTSQVGVPTLANLGQNGYGLRPGRTRCRWRQSGRLRS